MTDTSSSSSSRDTITENLNRLVSIIPSKSWLDACFQHINDTDSSALAKLDDYCAAVLHQILHSDLRNVVRNVSIEPNNSDPYELNSHSTVLRNAIIESIHRIREPPSYTSTAATASTKVSLPPNFKLLVQIEELLDVSLNAEDRLKVGPSSLSSPTAVGNQRHRCLKMVFSDGYLDRNIHHTVLSSNSSSAHVSTSNLIAMEISPIPNLSVNSQPGIKILLRGSITIRMGILLLNETNAVVLGGCVKDIIPYQQKAREKAARIAGIGVDPTIKALIGNSQKEVENDQDEGEHESVDVTERSRTVDATLNAVGVHEGIQSHHHPTTFPQLKSTSSSVAMATNITTTAVAAISTYSSSHATVTRALHDPAQGLPVSNTAGNGNLILPNKRLLDSVSSRSTTNPYTKLQEATTSSLAMKSSVETAAILQQRLGLNLNNNQDNGRILANNLTTSHVSTTHLYGPLDRAGPSTSTTNSTTILPLLAVEANQPSNMYNVPLHHDDLTDPQTSHDLMKHYSSLETSHPALYKVLSFGDFRSLLQLLFKDPVMYASYESKIFIVPSKLSLIQPDYGFKILKNKIWKSKSEKYYYTSTIKMTGTDVKDGDSITCRLSNAILEKCIGVSPDQLRVLLNQSEETRQQGNNSISDGVKMALNQLRNLVSCNFKLLMSKDECFPSSLEGSLITQVDSDDQPIVMLNSFEFS